MHWAAVVDYATAEDVMLEAFRNAAGRLPYANKVRSARMTHAVLPAARFRLAPAGTDAEAAPLAWVAIVTDAA